MHRPNFHFTPPHDWMNDPNGMVWHAGEYHLFYQHYPASTVWGPMHWGHAVSRDLVNWEHLPIALYPDDHGTIFSGSAVVDKKNTSGFGHEALVAIFTHHTDEGESQSLAYSIDHGYTWTKYSNNPVIQTPASMKNFRDPKVFWHADHWVMCLSGGDQILFYISNDLIHWEQTGSFGNGYDSTQGVWETPDLFQLHVDDSAETRWVLTTGVINGAPAGGSGTQYFIGNFDGKVFTSEAPKETILWMDYGADFYAPQSWNNEPNGRRLMLGWMNNWEYAKIIPASTWRGMFSLIREISLTHTNAGIRLIQKPLPELQFLRSEHHHWQDEIIRPDTNLLANIHGNSLEIIAEFKINNDVDRFGFHVRVGSAESTTIYYLVKDETLTVDRTKSGEVNFHENFPRIHSTQLSPINDHIKLQIFIDTSSVEVFANDGLLAFTECIFPAEQNAGLELFVEGGSIMINSLDVFYLNPAKFQIKENLP